MPSGCSQENVKRDGPGSLSHVLRPWFFLRPIPGAELYMLSVIVLLACGYALSIILPYRTPGMLEGLGIDHLLLVATVLLPCLTLWVSLWLVGEGVRRSLSRKVGYLPLLTTLVAHAAAFCLASGRLGGIDKASVFAVPFLACWLVQVCLVVNPYNHLAGLSSVGRTEGWSCILAHLRRPARLSEPLSSQLPVVHIYARPVFYLVGTGSVGIFLLMADLLSVAIGRNRYGEAYSQVEVYLAVRDAALAAAAAISVGWYQSALHYLRREAEAVGKQNVPEHKRRCTIHVQQLPDNESALVTVTLPHGRRERGDTFGDRGFVEDVASRFDQLLDHPEQRHPKLRFRDSTAVPGEDRFMKLIEEVGREVTNRYLSGVARAPLDLLGRLVAPSEPMTILQVECDEYYDAIPWELAHFGKRPLCLRFPVVRISGSERHGLPPGTPHAVLVGASAEESDGEVHLEGVNAEVRAVRRVLTTANWDVTLLLGAEATVDRVREVFEESERVDVFHFSGHSHFVHADQPNSYLRLYGDAQLRASSLINLVSLKRPWLAFLNGCETARRGRYGLNSVRGLSDAMNAAYAHYVLGMRWPVTDKGATELAKVFYTHLARGECPEASLWGARKSLSIQSEPCLPCWAAPCLYRN